MEIEFSLKREEYEEFVKAAYARISRISKASGKIFVINIVVWVFFGFGIAGVINFYEEYQYLDFENLNISLIAMVIGVIGFMVGNIFQQRLFLKYSISESGQMLKSQKVQVSEHGLTYLTNNCTQSYEWEAIQELEESKKLYCFYIDNNQALLVPKRAINEIGGSEEFLKYINFAKRSDK
ncbi:MAG: YcxB family protein [Candidatus Thiodiazotropha endolucinida]|nr:YcxB family protein [Candidatus Thiodiazotropha endolucinida]